MRPRRARAEVEFLNYAHAVDLAYREYYANNVGRARELLESCPPKLRHWEWHHVHRLCHGDAVTLTCDAAGLADAAVAADGRLLTAARDGTVRIWNPLSGAELARLRGHTGRVSSSRSTATPAASWPRDSARTERAC